MPLNKPISSFAGQRVWIIGASSGIGAACAEAFIEEGAQIAISARRTELLNDIKSKYPNSSIEVQACDVSDPASIQTCYDTLIQRWGEIDLVLFVSGIYTPLRAEQFTLVKAKPIMDVNVMGPMATVATVLPKMLERGHGGIGIVSSVAGYSGLPKALAYGPSKAAMINFCETLFYDLQPKNINVYMINPGFVETPATAKNDFYMPGLISSAHAAQEILQGLKRGEFDIHFPKGFTRFLKFLRILPYPLYFYLVRKFVKI